MSNQNYKHDHAAKTATNNALTVTTAQVSLGRSTCTSTAPSPRSALFTDTLRDEHVLPGGTQGALEVQLFGGGVSVTVAQTVVAGASNTQSTGTYTIVCIMHATKC